MQTLNSTKIDNESTFDSELYVKLVGYNSDDIKLAKDEGKTIDQLVYEKYNSYGWNCGHSYDCCGCWAAFVLKITTIRKGLKAVTVNYLKNV